MTAALDIDTPGFVDDPYANYARLRETSPVAISELRGAPRYSLLRYDDVAAAFRDPRLRTSHVPPAAIEAMRDSGNEPLVNLAHLQQAVLALVDPPDPTRLRALVDSAFTPRAVASLRGRVEGAVRELLDRVSNRGEMDLIADLAVPLPLFVIADLLGVPVDERESLKRWSDAMAPLLDRTRQAGAWTPAAKAALECSEYFGGLVARRRREPRNDLISGLVAARENDDASSFDELVAICIFLLGAGHETTTNLIGNGMLALLRDPEELARLRVRPELLPHAVEELLRFDAPVQRTVRVATERIEIRDVVIPKGGTVDLVIGSANRDPKRFHAPEHLDIARPDNRHLSFGGGIHFCVGAALARLEGEVAIGALLHRFPKLEISSAALDWRPGNLLRGLVSLPIAF